MKQKIIKNTPDTPVLAANAQNQLAELVLFGLYPNLLTAICIILFILTIPSGLGWQWGLIVFILGLSMGLVNFSLMDQRSREHGFSDEHLMRSVLCPMSTHQLLLTPLVCWDRARLNKHTIRNGSDWGSCLNSIPVPKLCALAHNGNQE